MMCFQQQKLNWWTIRHVMWKIQTTFKNMEEKQQNSYMIWILIGLEENKRTR